MSFVRQTKTAGDFQITKYYYTGRYHPAGEKRAKRIKPSPESVKRANIKHAIEKLTLKLHANFKIDDYWVTLTYRKDNKSITLEQMKNDIKRYFENLRREYQKQGKELKYVCVLRVGERGSRHFHIVINDEGISRDLIRKHWKHGHVNIAAIYEQSDRGTFEDIAAYMIKESETTREALKKPNLKRYSCSRNLAEPKVETVIFRKSSTFKYKPKPSKGWEIIKNSEKLNYNIYGFLYYEYKCKRIKEKPKIKIKQQPFSA